MVDPEHFLPFNNNIALCMASHGKGCHEPEFRFTGGPVALTWIWFELAYILTFSCLQKFRKPIFLCLTQFLGLAFYFPFSSWSREVQKQITMYKIAASSTLGAMTFLCLVFGLVYLPLSSAILVRVSSLHKSSRD